MAHAALADGWANIELGLPIGAVELRESFKKAGFRQQERQLTYAIKRAEQESATWLEAGFNFVLFDLTSQYGMSPGRSLRMLVLLMFVYAVPYAIALSRRQGGGIWMSWNKDRLPKDDGCDDPVRLTRRGLPLILTALYFSFLSAASIGWKEINVGSWVARVQAHEYTLRATGWVRTVSGIQSVLSVYLLALWALTYFGRPFE